MAAIIEFTKTITKTSQRLISNNFIFERIKFYCCFVVCFCITCLATAQPETSHYREDLVCGIIAGANYSSIEGLDQTILSEPFFINYTLAKKARKGFNAGFFLNYRGMASNHIGAQFELAYSQQGSDLNFNNYQTDFNYKIQFKYQYININTILHYYPGDYKADEPYVFLSQMRFSAGFRFGLNVAPSNIIYTSGGSGRSQAFGSDLEQQQQLRNVLKGKSSVGLVFGAGYEISNFMLDLRYNLGLNDVVETQANSYNFIENKNTNTFWQVSISFYLPSN